MLTVPTLLTYLGIVVIYFIVSYLMYKKLEDINVFPMMYDVYTGKKSRAVYYEFTRTFFFFLLAILFFVKQYIVIGIAFLLFTLVQFFVMKERMGKEKELEQAYQIEFPSTVTAEGTHKIIITKDYLYLGKPRFLDALRLNKRNKIPVYDKMFSYIILSSIERENLDLVVKFGFLGSPMFKRVLSFPTGYEKEIDTIIEKTKEMRKNAGKGKVNFDLERKMIDVFFHKKRKTKK